MPTISELLDGCVAIYVKAGTTACWACSVAAVTNKSCDQCGGAGEMVPPANMVAGPVCAELIRLVVSMRDASRWGAMNEALDWGTRFLDGCLEVAASDPEQIEQFQAAVSRITEAGVDVAQDMKDRSTLRPASGLSRAELEELGALEP